MQGGYFSRLDPVDYIRIAFLALLSFLTYLSLKSGGVMLLVNLDLVFHEAGHIFVFFLGYDMQILAGSLFQLFIPILFAGHFFFAGNLFAMYVLLWWFGENFLYISAYVGDARAQTLPLLGGDGTHDWAYLLSRVDALKYDMLIAKVLFYIGAGIMIISIFAAFKGCIMKRGSKNPPKRSA